MARRSASWAAGSSPACASSTTGRTQPPEAAERVADQLRMGGLLELERMTELPLAIFRRGLVHSPEIVPRLRLAHRTSDCWGHRELVSVEIGGTRLIKQK